MSQQHELGKYGDLGSETVVEQAGVGRVDGEGVDGEEVDGEEVDGERASAVTGSAGDADAGGWSGRAIGPLSGLLPGGAVDLTADEMPSEQPTTAVQAADQDSASVAAGTNGDEAATDVPAEDQKPTASAGAGDHEPGAVLVADDAQPAEAAQATAQTELGRTGTDDRWHSALVGFVDDPRGSVEAARALIDEDVAAHIALLARRREAMHAAWQADKDADTEALRVALVHYRNLRDRLADVVAALT